jgi:hypothetical protein
VTEGNSSGIGDTTRPPDGASAAGATGGCGGFDVMAGEVLFASFEMYKQTEYLPFHQHHVVVTFRQRNYKHCDR